jgi:hypothetical protein
MAEDVHGHGEDDGRVVLRRDAVQRLEVAELERERSCRGQGRKCYNLQKWLTEQIFICKY